MHTHMRTYAHTQVCLCKEDTDKGYNNRDEQSDSGWSQLQFQFSLQAKPVMQSQTTAAQYFE